MDIVSQPNFMQPVRSVGPPASGVGPTNVQQVFGVGQFNQMQGTSNAPSELQINEDPVHFTLTFTAVARCYSSTNPLHTRWMIGDLMFAQRFQTLIGGNDKSLVLANLPQLNIAMAEKYKSNVTDATKFQANAAHIPDEERLLSLPKPFATDANLNKLATKSDVELADLMNPSSKNFEAPFYQKYWAMCIPGILSRWNLLGVLYLNNNAGNHTPGAPGQSYGSRMTTLTLTMANKGVLNLLNIAPEAATDDRVFLYLTRDKVKTDAGKVTYGPYVFRVHACRDEAPPTRLLMHRDIGGRVRMGWWCCLGIIKDMRGAPPPTKLLEAACGRTRNNSGDARDHAIALGASINMSYRARPQDHDPVWI